VFFLKKRFLGRGGGDVAPHRGFFKLNLCETRCCSGICTRLQSSRRGSFRPGTMKGSPLSGVPSGVEKKRAGRASTSSSSRRAPKSSPGAKSPLHRMTRSDEDLTGIDLGCQQALEDPISASLQQNAAAAKRVEPNCEASNHPTAPLSLFKGRGGASFKKK